MDLSIILGGCRMETPIFNASGVHCTTYDELDGLNESESSAVVTKSCTILPRSGNLGRRVYYESDKLSINSTGLANMGCDYYLEYNKLLKKPYILSMAGLSLVDNLNMLEKIKDESIVDMVELNLSCPNIVGMKPVIYNFPIVEEHIRTIFERGFSKPLGLKLPYFRDYEILEFSDIISEYPISFVTCINSLTGFALNAENESTYIKPNGGVGGVGGIVTKLFALHNVAQFRKNLPDKIDVVGCGGVQSGIDVFSYILAGATAVQVGTYLGVHGPSIFETLNNEFRSIVTKKGYKTVYQFKGQYTS